jgi:predicted hydrocarbon binding protein
MGEEVYKIDRVQNEAWIRILEAGVRVVIMRAGTLVDLQKGVEAIIGNEASVVFYEAGIRAGKNSTKVLLEEWEERGREFLKRWGDFYKSAGVGWFKLEEIEVDFEKRNGYIRIKQSFIAEEYGSSDRPVCHFLSGFFVGVLEEIFGEKLMGKQIKCISKGDPYCEFQFEKY